MAYIALSVVVWGALGYSAARIWVRESRRSGLGDGRGFAVFLWLIGPLGLVCAVFDSAIDGGYHSERIDAFLRKVLP